MKIILYFGTSANGFIAPYDEKNYDFFSDADWKLYNNELKKAGVYVMGRRTYESCLRTGSFPFNCLNVVMTSKKIKNRWPSKVIFTDKSPKEVLKTLEAKGFDKVIVTGGILAGSFMKQKLINEIWIDLMPSVFWPGIPIFSSSRFNADVKLLSVRRYPSKNELQLRYKVVKYH